MDGFLQFAHGTNSTVIAHMKLVLHSRVGWNKCSKKNYLHEEQEMFVAAVSAVQRFVFAGNIVVVEVGHSNFVDAMHVLVVA